MSIKVKMAFANLIDKYTGWCWADLVGWAYGYQKFSEINRKDCQKDGRMYMPGCGCWCGKFLEDETGTCVKRDPF